MIKVTNIIIPEVGKFYLVKHAVMKYPDKNHERFGVVITIPVIGEPHTDHQFNFLNKHYHIDGRFFKKQPNIRYDVDSLGKSNNVIACEGIDNGLSLTDIVWLKRKCIRTTTGIHIPVIIRNGDWVNFDSLYVRWYKSMVGKNCKGRKCPHLGQTMLEENGQLVCPLHHLIGDIKTEKILPLEKTFVNVKREIIDVQQTFEELLGVK